MKTDAEVIAYIEKLLPDFREHKRIITLAYGKERVQRVLKERVVTFRDAFEQIKKDIPDIRIEDVVNSFNEIVDKRCATEGGDILDNLYNKQLNIITGMIIRGYEV